MREEQHEKGRSKAVVTVWSGERTGSKWKMNLRRRWGLGGRDLLKNHFESTKDRILFYVRQEKDMSKKSVYFHDTE